MAQNFRANMDPSVKPGDDFWQYAVGTWLKNNPIDKEYPMNGAFVDLEKANELRINALIMKYADKKDLPQGSDGQTEDRCALPPPDGQRGPQQDGL